jgi:Putative auto-transporter adhesin, head GIN domain
MRNIFLSLIMLVFTTAIYAQDKIINDPNAEVRNVGSFTGIKVSTGIELMLKQGNEDAVAVSSSRKEYTNRIITEVENGVLKIYFNSKDGWENHPKNTRLRAYVSIRSLNKLHGSSGATVKVDGVLNISSLDMDFNSGSIFNGEIKGSTLNIKQGSGSIVNISGDVETLSVKSSSGSICKGYELATQTCNADASSGGIIEISVAKELEAEASSGGLVHYKGTGTIKNLSTSSGGSIRKG